MQTNMPKAAFRIAVFSDTHGNCSNAPLFVDRLGKVDALFHLGDYAHDADFLSKLFACPAYAVRGNCDYSFKAPLEREVELYGKRFFLTHGHMYRDEYALRLRAEEKRCDMLLFGHTHEPLLTAEGACLLLNPGSATLPRGGRPCSCALVTVDEDEVLRADVLLLGHKNGNLR